MFAEGHVLGIDLLHFIDKLIFFLCISGGKRAHHGEIGEKIIAWRNILGLHHVHHLRARFNALHHGIHGRLRILTFFSSR
ncbi:hypothetical protein D3C79_956580 [compost metagenome]